MSYDMTEDDLRTMFAEAGTVQLVELIKDRDTNRPKGFAFVTMGSQAEAEKAISMFNEKSVNNRALVVNMARPREERPFGGRSYGGGGGGGGRSRSGGSSNRGRGGFNNRY